MSNECFHSNPYRYLNKWWLCLKYDCCSAFAMLFINSANTFIYHLLYVGHYLLLRTQTGAKPSCPFEEFIICLFTDVHTRAVCGDLSVQILWELKGMGWGVSGGGSLPRGVEVGFVEENDTYMTWAFSTEKQVEGVNEVEGSCGQGEQLCVGNKET